MERVLRLNLLSFSSPNPKRRWLKSLAHQQLVSGHLQRPWMSLEPRFWEYRLLPESPTSPTMISKIVIAATELQRKGNLTEAAAVLNKEITEHPLEPVLLEQRGVMACQQKDLLVAECYFQLALAQNPYQQIAKSCLEHILPEVESLQNTALIRVHDLAARLDHIPRCNPELAASLRDAFYHYAWSTLAIEGNEMSLEEVTSLLEKRVKVIEGRRIEKDHHEVQGLEDAIDYVIDASLMRVGASHCR